MIYIGIYLVIGIILAVWAHVVTLSSERWAIPTFTLIFFWGLLILWRTIEFAIEKNKGG